MKALSQSLPGNSRGRKSVKVEPPPRRRLALRVSRPGPGPRRDVVDENCHASDSYTRYTAWSRARVHLPDIRPLLIPLSSSSSLQDRFPSVYPRFIVSHFPLGLEILLPPRSFLPSLPRNSFNPFSLSAVRWLPESTLLPSPPPAIRGPDGPRVSLSVSRA